MLALARGAGGKVGAAWGQGGCLLTGEGLGEGALGERVPPSLAFGCQAGGFGGLRGGPLGPHRGIGAAASRGPVVVRADRGPLVASCEAGWGDRSPWGAVGLG